MKELRKPMIKTLISVWALAGDSLSLLLNGYATEVPLAKYIFTMLESLNANRLLYLFAFLGTGACFCLVRDRQKSPYITALSAFFAVCTVFGISYSKTGSWDCIFLFGTQFLLAVFVGLGYYFLYKNFILLVQYLFSVKQEWLHSYEAERAGKVDRLLFEVHSFWGPFGFLMLCGLPWLIAFFPGTLQWDAHTQLWMALGVIRQTSYHPVFLSNYMAGCVKLGRFLFGSDSMGLFFYTFPQFVAQNLVFSYVLYLMKKLNSPMLFRWGALLFWGVFPYFQIWGFTMVKDTPYYIGFVLFVTALVDVLTGIQKPGKVLWQYLLFALAGGMMVLARNDGRYVVFFSLLVFLVCYRKYWKLFALGMGTCLCLLIVEEEIYMPLHGIGKGPVGEMLSLPLQQTARYLRDHFEDVTQEEYEILQEGFEVELSEIPHKYQAEISDPVKSNFVDDPDMEYLKRYAGVWLAQFKRHPDTYVQATLNQMFAYFYPDSPNYGDYLTVTYLGNSAHWQDGSLDFSFGIQNEMMREFLRHLIYTVEKMPGVSLFYACGSYTFMLFGMAVWLFGHRKREVCVLAPAFCILLICLVSPVNGYLRYMMPVMAAVPVMLAWCYSCGQ